MWDRYAAFVDYRVVVSRESLQLSYERDGVPMQQYIQLVETTPNYGGVRWWFLCSRCERRVSRLHVPTRGLFHFLCRHCHYLTYESVQASRTNSEKFFKEIAQDLESTTRKARLWFSVMRDRVVHQVKRPIIDKVRERRTGIALEVTKRAREKGLSV